MSLIVETGSGLENAESYCSVADADSYHAKHGNAAWGTLATGDKEIALRRATAYMQQAYSQRWDGWRSTIGQALDWPRSEVRRRDAPQGYGNVYGFVTSYYPSDAIPAEIVSACAMLALQSRTADLLPNIEPAVAAESVGPISVTYVNGGTSLTRYTAVEYLLAKFFSSGAGRISLTRS